jgi:hypothetical protein
MNNLTGLDDESREELKNKNQEATHQYQIVLQALENVPYQFVKKKFNCKSSLDYKEKKTCSRGIFSQP